MDVKDNASYLIGYSSGSQLSGIPYEFDVESFLKGVQAALEKKPSGFEPAEAQRILTEWQRSLQQKASEKAAENKEKGKQFLAENLKNDKDVKQTASGLQYKVNVMGTGAKPAATDRVKVHYEGRLLSGEKFDSSIDRGEPTSFPLNAVIKGWTEGLQLMPVGSKFTFYIPAELGYGDRAVSTIPAGSTLVFEVELIEINPAE